MMAAPHGNRSKRRTGSSRWASMRRRLHLHAARPRRTRRDRSHGSEHAGGGREVGKQKRRQRQQPLLALPVAGAAPRPEKAGEPPKRPLPPRPPSPPLAITRSERMRAQSRGGWSVGRWRNASASRTIATVWHPSVSIDHSLMVGSLFFSPFRGRSGCRWRPAHSTPAAAAGSLALQGKALPGEMPGRACRAGTALGNQGMCRVHLCWGPGFELSCTGLLFLQRLFSVSVLQSQISRTEVPMDLRVLRLGGSSRSRHPTSYSIDHPKLPCARATIRSRRPSGAPNLSECLGSMNVAALVRKGTS